MSMYNIWAYIVLGLSYFCGISALLIRIWPLRSYNSIWRTKIKYPAMLCLFVSVLLMILSFVIGSQKNLATSWTYIFPNTLGFFSLDAEYEEFIKCAQCAFCGWGVWLFYAEYFVYAIIAPVLGGAFILNVIIEFLPMLQLWVNCKKTKYVFSELNERSITLAESIAELSWELNRWHSVKSRKKLKEEFDKKGIDPNERKWLKSACIVFTDAYADKQAENSSELLMRAQRIGAICLKDDILERFFHWPRHHKKLVYFLMDSNEENNVTTAISLLSTNRSKKTQKKTEGKSGLWIKTIRKTKVKLFPENAEEERKKKQNKYTSKRQVEMYVFTQDGESVRLIDKAKNEFVDQIKDAFVDRAIERAHKKQRKTRDRRAKDELMNQLKEAKINKDNQYKELKQQHLLLTFNLRVKCINEYSNLVYKMFDDRKLLDEFVSSTTDLPNTSSDNPTFQNSDIYKIWHNYFEKNRSVASAHTIRVVILGAGRLAKEYIKTAAWCYKMCSCVNNDNEVDDIEILVFAKNATELQNQLLLEAKELLTYDCKVRFFDADFPSINFFAMFNSEINLKKRPVQKVLVALGDDRMNYDAARWIKACFEQQLGIDASNAPIVLDFAIENNDLCEVLNKEFNVDKDKNDWCLLRPFSTLKDCFSYTSIRMDDLETRGLEANHLYQTSNHDTDDYFDNNYKWKSSVAVALHTIYKWFSRAEIGKDSDRLSDSLYKLMLGNSDLNSTVTDIENKIYWLEHRRWIAYMHSDGYRCPTAKEFVNLAFDKYGSYIKNKDDLRRLHACILFSNEKHIAIEKLLERFFAYHTKENPLGEEREKLNSSIENEDKVFAQTVTKTQDALPPIKEKKLSEEDIKAVTALKIAITTMQDGTQDKPLSEWLKDIVLPTDNEIDNLDRLSLLVTLTSKSETPKDFKVYDVELSRGLCLQILKLQIDKIFVSGFNNDNAKAKRRKLTQLVEILINADKPTNKELSGGARVVSITDKLELDQLNPDQLNPDQSEPDKLEHLKLELVEREPVEKQEIKFKLTTAQKVSYWTLKEKSKKKHIERKTKKENKNV